jgi:hypothetical protein
VSDRKKELIVRKADEISYRPGGLPGVPDKTYVDDQGRVIEIRHVQGSPEYRGDDLLRRFVPYFVLSTMAMILLGGVIALLGMIIPPLLALVITLVGSLVSIILSLVVTIIAGVIAAVGIGYLQTINAKIDREDDQD